MPLFIPSARAEGEVSGTVASHPGKRHSCIVLSHLTNKQNKKYIRYCTIVRIS